MSQDKGDVGAPGLQLRKADIWQIVRFLAVGVLNTAFGYIVFAAGILAGLPSGIALAIAMVIGVIFNFFTLGRLVFDSRDPTRLPRFVGVYALTYIVNLMLLRLWEGAGVGPLLAQLACLPVTVSLTFVLMRFLVFR
jgi:putative flippase GtrA